MKKIIAVLILVLIFITFFADKFLTVRQVVPLTQQEMKKIASEVKSFQPYLYAIKSITLNITHPLSFPNIRWAMPILVKIDSSTCSPSRISDIRYAMELWQQATGGTVSFKESDDYQVWVNCTSENESRKEESFVITKLGEGGPSRILPTDYFNLSIEGYAKIVSTTKDCIKPVRILHEFGHILGLDHVNDSKSILYPYEDCQQDFTPEIIQTIKELYKVEALPDLYLANASASSFNQYLNISFVVRNGGILSSAPTKIKISADGKELKDYEIETIQPGRGLSISFAFINAGKAVNETTIVIDRENTFEEYDKGNNMAVLRTS